MNQSGNRFIETKTLKSHANSLNLRFLDDAELEFYEQHRLLLPSVRRNLPRDYVVATTQQGLGLPVANQEDLNPPEPLRKLSRAHANGLHPFEAELSRNPLLSTFEHSTFEPWNTDAAVDVAVSEGDTLRESLVERYYAPWHVHVVARLRWNKFYYVHSRFMRHIEPSHQLWQRHRLPEDPERIRSLRGMATGFKVLERFRHSDRIALDEAFDRTPAGKPLSDTAQRCLRATQARWARKALKMSEMDEAGLFAFLGELAALIDEYRSDERLALADDAEQYVRDAIRLAMHAYSLDWREFLAVVQDRAGVGLAATLRRLDPVESAADAAQRKLTRTVEQPHLVAIVSRRGGAAGIADEVVEFCLDHDLLEVLYSLQRSSYTDADRRADRYPGFFNRRLRPLALAGEQVLQAILESRAGGELDTSEATTMPHYRRNYSELIKIIGQDSAWLPHFKTLMSNGMTSDKGGDLDKRAVQLAEATRAIGISPDEVIANTLGAAVAARNLVSHRYRFLETRIVNRLAGPCADAVPLIWFLARDKGFV